MGEEDIDPRLAALAQVASTPPAAPDEPVAADVTIERWLADDEAVAAEVSIERWLADDEAIIDPTAELEAAKPVEAPAVIIGPAPVAIGDRVPAPVAIGDPEPLPPSAELFHMPILVGFPARAHELRVEELGFRVDTERRLAVPWTEVTAVAGRGHVAVRTKAGSIAFALALDGVGEPTLAAPFARVLDEARHGSLDLSGTAFNDLQNAMDALRDRFYEGDDALLPAMLGAAMALLTLVFTILLPDALAIGTLPAPAADGFLIGSRVSPLDPRVVLAATGAAGMLAAFAAWAALGHQAGAWARGTLRGWHRERTALIGPARRAMALVVRSPALGAAAVLLGVVAALPSARTQTIVDATGVTTVHELPFLDRHSPWSSVSELLTVPAPGGRHAEGVAVLIRFGNGPALNTSDLYVRNGTDRQMYEMARGWWKAARP